MSTNSKDFERKENDREINDKDHLESKESEQIIEKDFVPHFFPTYRIKQKFYPIPIIIAVVCAGFLTYATIVLAGVEIEGGYISEKEFGAAGGILNGLIFTIVAAISSFIIILIVKKKGINVLKYVFSISFGFLGFFLTWFFAEILIYLIFVQFPESELVYNSYMFLINYILPAGGFIFTFILLYEYLTSRSIRVKNFTVLYIGTLTGALLGAIMPLWTTLAILIGISLWDIFAVKSKRGPIKEMIDIASINSQNNILSEKELKAKFETGEVEYDTSKLEIGIGDLAFYSMLTSSALIFSQNLIVTILTAVAIIIGTGITITGLKRNKILPGLPISIFLGLGTMILSWYVLSIFFK